MKDMMETDRHGREIDINKEIHSRKLYAIILLLLCNAKPSSSAGAVCRAIDQTLTGPGQSSRTKRAPVQQNRYLRWYQLTLDDPCQQSHLFSPHQQKNVSFSSLGMYQLTYNVFRPAIRGWVAHDPPRTILCFPSKKSAVPTYIALALERVGKGGGCGSLHGMSDRPV